MSIRNKYEAELNLVFNKLLQMCRTTEIAIEKSVTALVRRDKEVSREVIAEDKFVDNLEHEIEQDCLKILLMEHPSNGLRIRRRIFPKSRCNSATKNSSKSRNISNSWRNMRSKW